MLEIIYLPISELKPYGKNARKHAERDVYAIQTSIERFGMNDPIGIWGDKNIIVEGHGRLEACKRLGIGEVPCVRLDHLTNEQRREYAIAHNATAELSEWDFDLLNEEIAELDFGGFDFEFVLKSKEWEAGLDENEERRNERERTMSTYNLDLYDSFYTDGKYQMPIIDPVDYIPKELIGFNFVLSSANKSSGVHFYVDDYQFERVWSCPEKYLEKIAEFDCMLTPDFSLYTEMALPVKIWNTYRSRLIGQYAQRMGLTVIPTVSWREASTFDFCFDGLPKKSTLSISTIGVKRGNYNYDIWKAGVDEMMERLQPKTLLVYGGEVDYDFGDVRTINYQNKVTERMSNGR